MNHIIKKHNDDLIKIIDKIPLPYIKELGYYGITEEVGNSGDFILYFWKRTEKEGKDKSWFTLSDEK